MKPDRLTPRDIKAFKKLLNKLPSLPNIPQELFTSLMSKNVPVTVELAIIINRTVLLTYRNDPYYVGWHFPGSWMSPGETFEGACRCMAFKEAGLRLSKIKLLHVLNVPLDVRFHHVSLIFLCSSAGNPGDGTWFSKRPSDLLAQHRIHWRLIQPYLRGTRKF